MWNLPPPPGFQGFDAQRPMRIYHRHLPHWRQEGVTYFVTFRLADSLPQSKLRELMALRDTWRAQMRRSTTPSYLAWEQLTRTTMQRVEHWLDEGMGNCVLRSDHASRTVEECLRHEDGKNYELAAFVIMPNHVHLLARPYSDAVFSLEKLAQAWKCHSSRLIRELEGEKGPLWQEESFDRIVRDEEHLFRCLQYIGRNPRMAGLSLESCRRWVRDDWQAAGWGFDREM